MQVIWLAQHPSQSCVAAEAATSLDCALIPEQALVVGKGLPMQAVGCCLQALGPPGHCLSRQQLCQTLPELSWAAEDCAQSVSGSELDHLDPGLLLQMHVHFAVD